MANIFKNSVTGSIGTTTTTVYTSPSQTVATVIGVNVANVISQNIENSGRSQSFVKKEETIW